MKQRKCHNLLPCLLLAFFCFAFPLYADSPLDEQLKTLLEEFSQQIEEAGSSIEYFETLLLADTDRPSDMEVLRLYLEKKIEDFKQTRRVSEGRNNGERNERIGSGGSVPRGGIVNASVQERDDSIDLSVSFSENAKTSMRLNKDADLIALLGQEMFDRQFVSLGTASPFSLMVINTNGSAYPVRRVNGRNVIKIKKDTSYQLVLENRFSEAVSVSVFIDGINTIFLERELPSVGLKWLVDPRSRFVLPGWQFNNNSVSSFVFTDSASGAAARLGYDITQGLITAVFYIEEKVQISGKSRGSLAATGFGEQYTQSLQEVYSAPAKKAVQIIQIYYEFDH